MKLALQVERYYAYKDISTKENGQRLFLLTHLYPQGVLQNTIDMDNWSGEDRYLFS